MATIAEFLACSNDLVNVSDSPALDVELLLSYCLDKNRTYLMTWPERELDGQVEQAFKALLHRRLQGEPIAYLIGSQGFWTLDLAVNPSTLIPRPETELLVELALERLPRKGIPEVECSELDCAVLDLGTGTGAIALAIASEHQQWQVLGCDVQAEAVALAETNRQHCAITNVQFIQSDWFQNIPRQRFDMIVSNPPYIDPNDTHLTQGDVRFEPHSALVAENKGLADIEHIVTVAKDYLKPDAWLMFEHGYDQGDAARELLREAGYQSIETVKDLAGLDRVTVGRNN